jgi:hypothetical protein
VFTLQGGIGRLLNPLHQFRIFLGIDDLIQGVFHAKAVGVEQEARYGVIPIR